MLNTYQYKKLTWIDLQAPTPNEVREVVDKYKIQPLIAEELITPNVKPKVDIYPEHIYLILHFPTFKRNDGLSDGSAQEIDFIIGKDFIITAHDKEIEPLRIFAKSFEINSILDKRQIGEHAGYIFYYMMRAIYNSLHDELEYTHSSLNAAEHKIFHGEEKNMVFRLSEINRDVLIFRESLNLHKEVLTSFEAAGKRFFSFDDKFDYYLRDIVGEFYKVQNSTQNCKDYLEELRRTNDSLLSTKQNEVSDQNPKQHNDNNNKAVTWVVTPACHRAVCH